MGMPDARSARIGTERSGMMAPIPEDLLARYIETVSAYTNSGYIITGLRDDASEGHLRCVLLREETGEHVTIGTRYLSLGDANEDIVDRPVYLLLIQYRSNDGTNWCKADAIVPVADV